MAMRMSAILKNIMLFGLLGANRAKGMLSWKQETLIIMIIKNMRRISLLPVAVTNKRGS